MEIFGILFFLLIFFCIALGVATFIFWIWALVDCISNEPAEGNDKLIWALVILLLHGIGALIYFFARRPERIRRFGK